MFNMITLECHGIRDAYCQVGYNSQDLVGSNGSKGEIMGDFVNRKEGVLIEGSSDRVGY